MLLLVVAVAAGGGLALAAGLSGAGAKGYSAYADPQKPVLSFILSDDKNIQEFQTEFGLGDAKMQEVLAVLRGEDRALSREYGESERIVESGGGASDTKIKAKIAGSDFDEKVRQTVAKTKSAVEELLPDGRVDDLGPWVDEQWRARPQSTGPRARPRTGPPPGLHVSGMASYYTGTPGTRWPSRTGGQVQRRAPRQDHPRQRGKRTRAPVKESGPWNTRDNYWRAKTDRSMWRNLPRCVPEAQAAFYDNYNRGEDQFGREVRNPAGMDITLAVARSMDVGKRIQRKGYIRVRVHFPWVRR